MKIESGIKAGPLKLCIYGTEGIGKTTFASHAPKPLFIDIESGSKLMDVARIEPAPTNWAELLEQVEYVIANPDVCDTLVIDTADAAETLAIDYVFEKENVTSLYGNYQKGSIALGREFNEFLKLLDEVIKAGINVIIIAHSRLKKFEQPEEIGAYDRYELKLQNKTCALVKEWCDGLFFCNYKTIVEKVNGQNKAYGGERVMYTTHHPAWDAKNRFALKEEMPLSYDMIDGLLYSKNTDDDYDILKDEAFTLMFDDTDVPIAETAAEKIRSRIKGTGVTEDHVVDAIIKSKMTTPKTGDLEIGDKIKLENFDEEWLENSVLNRFDSFIEFVKKSI